MMSTNRQTFQRSEGGGNHDSASLSSGLAGVGGTLTKLTRITIIILLIEKAFEIVNKRKLPSRNENIVWQNSVELTARFVIS